ncbi:MAG TPA: DUF4912 domain-containing protein [Verrucomicrobiae bacterium]|nr:DUF4912 domain-containing protein [Verrucomicrobiae bacterium]
MPFRIPPILLEGDEPARAAASGKVPEKKSTAEPAADKTNVPTGSPLSEALPSIHLHVTARDPYCLYVFWDLSFFDQQKLNAASARGALVLKAKTAQGKEAAEIHLHRDSRHWFAHVPEAGEAYRVQLGYYDKSNRWVSLALSEEARTPPDHAAGNQPVVFARISSLASTPAPTPVAESSSVGAQDARFPHHIQPPADLPKLEPPITVETYSELPLTTALIEPPSAVAEPPAWTTEQEEALEEIVYGAFRRQTAFESGEIPELLQGRRGARKQILRPKGFEFPSPSSAEIAGLVAGPPPEQALSSALLPSERPRERSFWFNINAELVVYGATEPDARVTIGGKPIRLRPDGTFSYRFALPDGYYELPAVAISADGFESRGAELRFTRFTRYEGDVAAHPQDTALRLAAPENTF